MLISWNEYKSQASEDLSSDGALIYRGQRLSSWKLTSSLHRTTLVRSMTALKAYADSILPLFHDALEAWVGRSWDLKNALGLAEFLAFLQHNSFPTPLLDWTSSPFIAAYFAFESVNHFSPQKDKVAIFSFNQRSWSNTFKQIYDFADLIPHVSILHPRMVGNHKLAVQQGCFTWTTVSDIEKHILVMQFAQVTFFSEL